MLPNALHRIVLIAIFFYIQALKNINDNFWRKIIKKCFEKFTRSEGNKSSKRMELHPVHTSTHTLNNNKQQKEIIKYDMINKKMRWKTSRYILKINWNVL